MIKFALNTYAEMMMNLNTNMNNNLTQMSSLVLVCLLVLVPAVQNLTWCYLGPNIVKYTYSWFQETIKILLGLWFNKILQFTRTRLIYGQAWTLTL